MERIPLLGLSLSLLAVGAAGTVPAPLVVVEAVATGVAEEWEHRGMTVVLVWLTRTEEEEEGLEVWDGLARRQGLVMEEME
jgi:hypothetical protein